MREQSTPSFTALSLGSASSSLPRQWLVRAPARFSGETATEHGAKLASGGQHSGIHLQWLITSKAGAWEPSRGPGAPEDLCAPKAEEGSGRALAWKQKIEAWGARTATSPFVTLATHQILGVSDVGGQTGASVSGGERAVPSPSPTRAVSILDVGEAAVPSSRAAAACLSPWQPGQKPDLPVSRL